MAHVSRCENLASAWEKKYQAEHAIAESFGETAAALRTARSDLALAEKKLAEVEEVSFYVTYPCCNCIYIYVYLYVC